MTMTETSQTPDRTGKKARLDWVPSLIAIAVVLLISSAPFVYVGLQRPRTWPPPQSTTISETPAQLRENAELLKVLSAMPAAKRLPYLSLHQEASKQVALSPNPEQKREIYALIGEKVPSGQ